MVIEYSKERLLAKEPAAIKQIRANALKAGRPDVGLLCERRLLTFRP